MAINVVSVQYIGGFNVPDMILLTQCYCHWGTRLKVMKRFFVFVLRVLFVCVCVVILFVLDVRVVDVVFCYQPGLHRRKVTQEEGHTGGSHRISHPPSFRGACLNCLRKI